MQQRGPPICPMEERLLAVIWLASPQEAPVKGVAPVAMLIKMPVLTPAPQVPHWPQIPPGT